MKNNIKIIFTLLYAVSFIALFSGVVVLNDLNSKIESQDNQMSTLKNRVADISTSIEVEIDKKIAIEKAEEEARLEKEAAAKKAAEEAEAAKNNTNTYTYTPPQQTVSEPEPTPSPKIYYFYDPNCGTCKAQTPIVQELNNEGVPFIFMNVDETPSYISQYNISLVPTFILNDHRESAFFNKSELLNFWNTYK